MNIQLNNRPELLNEEHVTVARLLELKNFTFRMLVVKINGKLIKKDQYAKSFIYEGDDVMVMHLVSGG